MIRLPPSVITLGRSDLLDYEERLQRRALETESLKRHLARFQIGGQDGPSFGLSKNRQTPSEDIQSQYSEGRKISMSLLHEIVGNTLDPTEFDYNLATDGLEETRSILLSSSHSRAPDIGLSDFFSHEDSSIEAQQASSPSKDEFHYSGFFESPVLHTTDDTTHRSSPFAPEYVSTPQNLLPPGTHRVRSRTLPRSPLFRSINHSSSPDRRPTSSLTPRVAARVATLNTPGIIFSNPPRRPAHTFRHQTNSFSFDSSNRASAAYEHDRTSSISTNDTIPRPSDDLNLHVELRGSSLGSSRVASGFSLPGNVSSGEREEGNELLHFTQVYDEMSDGRTTFIFSSPQLPPPFSTTPRNVSGAASLPSSPERIPGNARASPLRSSSTSPDRSGLEGRPPTIQESSPLADGREGLGSNLAQSSSGHSPRHILRSAARLVASYRTRSPVTRQGSPEHPSPSPSSSTSPRQAREGGRRRPFEAQTLSQSYQVYNDAVSAETQPQTPAQLPESRHQSRYHPSYTAPNPRAAARLEPHSIDNHDGASNQAWERRVPRALVTPSRLRLGRSDSPVGLLLDGFRGLYGGRENGDEEQSWVDGVRFSNAEVRLWGLRDTAGDGRDLRDTPEREEWRARRN